VHSSFAHSWLWFDGVFAPEAQLPVSDRGFRYGMSVFETLRIFEGTPDFVGPHLERLRSAALRCGFTAPEEAFRALPSLLSQWGGTGVARVYITAGDGAPTAPAEHCRVVVLFEPRSPVVPPTYALQSCPVPHLPPFGGLKTANYWANAEALRQARLCGADEALLFQPDGGLTGACMANVFVKTPAGWLTPTLRCGARDGVVRAWTLKNLSVHEARLTRETLQTAFSMFLSSSWIGLLQVRSLDGRPLELSAEIGELNPL
jgi:branched-subunit amino acid aminotransferase/4-amino-4-deoxychorismate lyase